MGIVMDEGIWIEFLEFPWWVECALERRFGGAILDVKLPLARIVKMLERVVESLTIIAHLVEDQQIKEKRLSEETASTSIEAKKIHEKEHGKMTSAKHFIDNMIHICATIMDQDALMIDSLFMSHFLEPLPALMRQLSANFHPLKHLFLSNNPERQM